jgi:hypothetical protein
MSVNAVQGIIEVLGGIVLTAGGMSFLPENGFVLTLAVVMLIMGAWFLISGLAQGKGSRFRGIFEGCLGLIASLLLFLIYGGTFHPVFAIPGVLVLFKGSWYLVVGLKE